MVNHGKSEFHCYSRCAFREKNTLEVDTKGSPHDLEATPDLAKKKPLGLAEEDLLSPKS